MKFRIPKSPFIFTMKPHIHACTSMFVKKNKQTKKNELWLVVSSHFQMTLNGKPTSKFISDPECAAYYPVKT